MLTSPCVVLDDIFSPASLHVAFWSQIWRYPRYASIFGWNSIWKDRDVGNMPKTTHGTTQGSDLDGLGTIHPPPMHQWARKSRITALSGPQAGPAPPGVGAHLVTQPDPGWAAQGRAPGACAGHGAVAGGGTVGYCASAAMFARFLRVFRRIFTAESACNEGSPSKMTPHGCFGVRNRAESL